MRKGLLLHASSVAISGKAILFLGHSNAGKSTISKLLSERYPMIADDKVWVFCPKDGNWMVQDASLDFRQIYFDNRRFRGESYPLLAIVRIFKGNVICMDSISSKETCMQLMNAVFEINLLRVIQSLAIKKEWFVAAAQISREIKGWRLTFPKCKSIITKIHEVFESE